MTTPETRTSSIGSTGAPTGAAEITGLDAAILQTVQALGGYAAVARGLKPDAPPKAATRWLRAACDPRCRESLSPWHLAIIRRLGRERGVHTLAEYECRAASYAAPVPLAPAQQIATLRREYIAGVARLQELAQRIERLCAAGTEAP